MTIVLSKQSKANLLDALLHLLDEALFPGVDFQMQEAVERGLRQVAQSPADISVHCTFQIDPTEKALKISLLLKDKV